MNPTELSNEEYIALLRTCKVLEGLMNDARVNPDVRQFAANIRNAIEALKQFVTFVVPEDEAEVV